VTGITKIAIHGRGKARTTALERVDASLVVNRRPPNTFALLQANRRMIARQIIRPENVETTARAIIYARRYVTRGTTRLLSVSDLSTGEKPPRRRSHKFIRNCRRFTGWRVVVYPNHRTAEI
jgi:hypothetical protein